MSEATDKYGRTIDDYSKDYFAAKERGDALGMRNANDSANQIRNDTGQAAQFAAEDISAVAKVQERTPVSQSGTAAVSTTDQIDTLYDAYLKQQLDALEADAKEVSPYYSGVRNNAAVTQAQNQNAFNEYAAATGLNSGAGGQAMLARQNVYGNAINAADVAEANAYSDLALQRSQLQGENALQRAQALYEEQVRQEELAQSQNQFNASLAANENELALSQQNYTAETEYGKLANAAEALAATGDFSGYQALYGWTDAQVAQAESVYRQKNTKAAKSSSGSGGSAMTLSTAEKLARNGVFTPEALQVLYANGYTDEIIQDALNPDFEPTGGAAALETSAAGGTQAASALTDQQFDSFLNSYLRQNSATSPELVIQDLYQRYLQGIISEAQYLKALDTLGV